MRISKFLGTLVKYPNSQHNFTIVAKKILTFMKINNHKYNEILYIIFNNHIFYIIYLFYYKDFLGHKKHYPVDFLVWIF